MSTSSGARATKLTPVHASIALLWCGLWAACGTHDVAVEFYAADGYRFAPSERRAIQTVADATAREVRRLLPALPRHLVLRVDPGRKVIPETGETATAVQPNIVIWTVDPHRSGGVSAIAETQLRPSLFHEFHHLVREATITPASLIDRAVTEGLATAFERDFAGASPPWGLYPAEAGAWVSELMALPPTVRREEWMSQHPDGRRWIAYKAGTFLVDRAMRASARSSAQLVATPTDEIVRMAR